MKLWKKNAVLLCVFLAAAVISFFKPFGKEEEHRAVSYTAVREASLPVVYPKMGEREMAPLFGQMEEKAVTAARDSLIVLPEDRKLPVRITDGQSVKAVRYEIRSLDTERLVERTEVSDLWQRENGIHALFPIQNLLEEGREYLLSIQVELSDGTAPWYYTRIVETDGTRAEQMCSLAEEFSLKTLDYESAQELTMYMETTAGADNSSFGTVTLKNSFSQLTWGSLNVERAGNASLKLKELSGDLANLELNYYVTRMEGASAELYAITENFTMRWAAQRIYMMDYERTMEQIFSGNPGLYSGKRILLGIESGEDLQSERSPGKRYTAFVANRALWAYDREKNRSLRVFSFGEAEPLKIRENLDWHGIEILSLTEEGELDFLVYGRMNRGGHEGYTGVSYYCCDLEDGLLEERFFLPVPESYEELKADLGVLAHKGASGTCYLYLGHAVYGIDLKSLEAVTIASGLNEETFAVSDDMSRIAWQENTGIYDSAFIHVMDLDSGVRTQLGGKEDHAYRILGFVGTDCIYGIGKKGDYVTSNGRRMGLYMGALDIVDKNMETVMHYEKDGSFIRDVEVDGSRIHIRRVRDKRNGFFGSYSEDTLVCNSEALPGSMDQIGWYASGLKGRVYFVELPSDIPSGRSVETASVRLAEADKPVAMERQNPGQVVEFYAYGRGRLLGRYLHFSDAVQAAHDAMGFVAACDGLVLWERGGKPNSAYIRDVQAAVRPMERCRADFAGNGWNEDGSFLLDASGTDLNQILSFVGQGIPVLLYLDEGQYLYVTGYGQGHVRVYWPGSGTSETIPTEEAAKQFEERGNDFLCRIPGE